MPYFEHDADVGVVGRGATLEEAFVSGAQAVFALMTHLESIQPRERVQVQFEEADPELAFVTWINQLLGHAHENGLVLGKFELARDGERWRGSAWGEPWRAEMERGVDVKGATLTMLSVAQRDGGWEARCVVDV
ncbi:MAG TPA: archease [Burkholderiales bacterium]|nr:archease [Burkholderiales bacterium]